jgi:alcohol dehydrogenase/L-iditol 2-dehydrogenase
MKAVVLYDKVDQSVEMRDVPVPVIRPDECLVEVKFCGICGSEAHMYHGQLTMLARTPVVLGHEWSGQVVEVGADVKDFAVGDRVTCETAAEVCGVCALCRSGNYNVCPERLAYGFAVDGAFTKYIRAKGMRLHHIPEGVSYESAAMTEPTCVAYNAVVEKSRIRPGDTVVVQGPGPVGLLAMQMAKIQGAGVVVVSGTGRDAKRLELAKKLGADMTVDVTQQNLLDVVRGLGDGLGAHLVIDAAGVPPAIQQSLQIVRQNGQVTKIGWALQPINLTMDEIVAKMITYQGAFSHTWTNWEASLELMRQGRILTEPMISEVWPITRWKEAFEKLEALEADKILLYPVD